jgi:parvulin-like peptidyl-prolyl isomerase
VEAMGLIVSGEKIEDSVIEREVERLRPHYEQVFKDKDSKEREEQLLDWSKENVIERILLNQHARKHGPQIPKADVEEVFSQLKERCENNEQLKQEFGSADEGKIKEEIEQRMKVELMLQEVCGKLEKPSKKAIGDFYEENKEQFKSAESIRVAHIVKHVNWQTDEAAAREIISKAQDELKKGAAFEMLVAKYSDCPDNGGDLGYITRGQMVEEFEDVVFNLPVGQPSEVFRTRFGFHIAKLYDRKPPAVASLEEVKDRIIEALTEQMHSKAVDDFVDRLRSEATIEDL